MEKRGCRGSFQEILSGHLGFAKDMFCMCLIKREYHSAGLLEGSFSESSRPLAI